jgi:hypothetical protein
MATLSKMIIKLNSHFAMVNSITIKIAKNSQTSIMIHPLADNGYLSPPSFTSQTSFLGASISSGSNHQPQSHVGCQSTHMARITIGYLSE